MTSLPFSFPKLWDYRNTAYPYSLTPEGNTWPGLGPQHIHSSIKETARDGSTKLSQ